MGGHRPSRGLGRRRRATFEALLPHVLGLELDDPAIPVAGGRLSDFCRSVSQKKARRGLRLLLDIVGALSIGEYLRLPADLDAIERTDFVERLFDSERRWPHNILDVLKHFGGEEVPSMLDMARFLKEVCAFAYYSSPLSDAFTGFEPLWTQERVLAVHPATASDHRWTREDRTRLDFEAISERHALGTESSPDGFFARDGRPTVAIVGAGAGGAAAAARLAPYFDVALFEAGPRLAPPEYPMDGMAAMSLLYDRAVLFPSKDRDLRVLAGRCVGGSSVINEGVSIRPRSRTLDAWQRGGAAFDRGELDAAIDAVERRQRFEPYAEDLLTSPSLLFEQGMSSLPGYRVERLRSDVATQIGQHAGQPHSQVDVIGPRCLACGYCNYGCRYGHHLSVDRTFLRDAEAAGARVHPNVDVRALAASSSPGSHQAEVTGLVLRRAGRRERVPVDHVVLAGGAIGSPALLLRSMRRSPALGVLPCREHVGRGLGFNYGSTVVARWPGPLETPGLRGLQVGFVATKPGDESFLVENGWITPTIFSTLCPGVGADHRRWMASWPHIGFAVNTIGSPSVGHITASGEVGFRVDAGQMGLVHETLADMVDGYLHAGAVEVGLAGVRSWDDGALRFDPSWRGRRAAICRQIQRAAPTAEHLALSSGHPQGGLGFGRTAQEGAVGADYRVHGTRNLYVADASLFPSTITINPQWMVMALGWAAGAAIGESIRSVGRD